MIGLLVPLAVLAGLVYLIVRNLQQRRPIEAGATSADSDTGENLRDAIGRFFRLGLLFSAVLLSTSGVAGLVREAWRRNNVLVRDPSSLAQPLAFTVVGLPALAGLALWTKRCLTNDPREVRSVGWARYLDLTTSVALVVAIIAWLDIGRWALRANEFNSASFGRSLSWSVVWALHWHLASRRPAAVVRREGDALFFGSTAGLVTCAIGLGGFMRSAFRMFYDSAFLSVLAGSYARGLRRAIATACLGAVVWWWYWHRTTVKRERTAWWHAYVLLIGVLGGLSVAVVGSARLLHAVLQWWFGQPANAGAADHFDLVPGALATVLVGANVWWYHRKVLRSTGARARVEADRIYQYLAAAVGLVTTAIGTTAAIAALLDATMAPASLTERPAVANAVVLAVTLLAVGGSTWLVFWSGAQRGLADVLERQSISRRVYLLLLFGVSAATALISLVILLVRAFEDLTAGDAGRATLFNIRVPFGLLLTTFAVAAYHALVHREDRAAAPSLAPIPMPVPTREVILLADDGQAAADAIEQALAAPVRRWHRVNGVELPGQSAALDTAKLVAAVQASAEPHVLVLERPGGAFEIVSFTES